jgi:hypothetical protein
MRIPADLRGATAILPFFFILLFVQAVYETSAAKVCAHEGKYIVCCMMHPSQMNTFVDALYSVAN